MYITNYSSLFSFLINMSTLKWYILKILSHHFSNMIPLMKHRSGLLLSHSYLATQLHLFSGLMVKQGKKLKTNLSLSY